MAIDKNEFFRKSTMCLCGSLDVNSALKCCFTYISQFIPMDTIGLYQFNTETNSYISIARVHPEGEDIFEDEFPMPEILRDEILARWKEMKPIEIINQPAQEPYYVKLSQEIEIELDVSKLVMKLELDGRRVGGVCVRADGINKYTERHAELFQMLHEPFAIAMANALKHREVLKLKDLLEDDNRYLHNQLRELSGTDIIGADFGLKNVIDMLRQVAPMDSPVLLLGETGTGKDVIANSIHSFSPRKNGPFIRVNCGAIPDTIIDSELFGHEKGAFTGAVSEKRGRFERAEGGTIFLDEIGELPPQAQVRLLHVIQNKEIERVGGSTPIPVNVRIISATHRNLQDMVQNGSFREDLWFRLNVFPIVIPPLRQRKEDIPALVHHFIERKRVELKLKTRPKLAPNALTPLNNYDWPGNVRELENIIERALIKNRNDLLDFHNQISAKSDTDKVFQIEKEQAETLILDQVMKSHIEYVLSLAQGKINGSGGAGELMGIHPNTLRKRMSKLNIQYGRNKT